MYENKTGNLKTAHYPQISLQATGSYQSDALKINLPIPGFKLDDFPKERIQSYLEVIQTVYNGGMISGAVKMEDKQFELDKKNLEIELRKIKAQVTQIYFACLLLNIKQQVLELTLIELNERIRNLQSGMNAGVVLETALNQLKAEKIRAEQKIIETKSEMKNIQVVMGIFLNRKLTDNVFWKIPDSEKLSEENSRRPELFLLELQIQKISTSMELIRAKRRPKLSLFAQGGYGMPAPLNFFNTEGDKYFITGFKFIWNVFDWGNFNREKKILSLQQDLVNTQKEVLEKNISMQLAKDEEEIQKYKQLLVKDEELINLLAGNLKQIGAQMENGVITPTDYLTALNNEQQARLNREVHRLLLIQAHENLRMDRGGL